MLSFFLTPTGIKIGGVMVFIAWCLFMTWWNKQPREDKKPRPKRLTRTYTGLGQYQDEYWKEDQDA